MNYKLEKFWNINVKRMWGKRFFMNYKLEKFWNEEETNVGGLKEAMNYKLEKFWNSLNIGYWYVTSVIMNYKLEKFWNILVITQNKKAVRWTINLKSFEMELVQIVVAILI